MHDTPRGDFPRGSEGSSSKVILQSTHPSPNQSHSQSPGITLSTVALLLTNDGNYFTFTKGREDHQKDVELLGNTNRKRYCSFYNRTKVYIQELGAYSYVKLVEDCLSVLSLCRKFDELGYSTHGHQEKIPDQRKEIRLLSDASHISYSLWW